MLYAVPVLKWAAIIGLGQELDARKKVFAKVTCQINAYNMSDRQAAVAAVQKKCNSLFLWCSGCRYGSAVG